MTISINWGQTATRKGAVASSQSLEASSWFTGSQIMNLDNLATKYNISEYRLVRGAFHGSYTRLIPIMDKLDSPDDYIAILHEIAEAIGWHYSIIDGAKAVTKQKPSGSTWDRWKKNNPSSHLREASKKNWEVFHSFIGDLDVVDEWEENKFTPDNWRKTFKQKCFKSKEMLEDEVFVSSLTEKEKESLERYASLV